MMPFACTGCGCKLCVRRNVTGKQVKCPRCGTATPLPHPRLDPLPLRPVSRVVPPPPKQVPQEAPPPPSEELKIGSTVETDYFEEPLPGAPPGESPPAKELAGFG